MQGGDSPSLDGVTCMEGTSRNLQGPGSRPAVAPSCGCRSAGTTGGSRMLLWSPGGSQGSGGRSSALGRGSAIVVWTLGEKGEGKRPSSKSRQLAGDKHGVGGSEVRAEALFRQHPPGNCRSRYSILGWLGRPSLGPAHSKRSLPGCCYPWARGALGILYTPTQAQRALHMQACGRLLRLADRQSPGLASLCAGHLLLPRQREGACCRHHRHLLGL